MISHRNVIANILQNKAYEEKYRTGRGRKPAITEVSLGLLPQSHIYALVVVCHLGTYRGDQTVVLPKFELHSYLKCIAHFKINCLFLVRHFPYWEETKIDRSRFPQSSSTC